MKRLSLVSLALALLGVGLVGCADPDLDRHYTSETAQTFPPTTAVAVIDGGLDAEQVYETKYRGRGYTQIGRVSFVGRYADDAPFVEFGKTIGADLVVVSRRHVESREVDTLNGPLNQYGGWPANHDYGGEEPMFDPRFMPGTHEDDGPASRVVRDYRQIAIYLRRTAG
jgi:hypothetical protein